MKIKKNLSYINKFLLVFIICSMVGVQGLQERELASLAGTSEVTHYDYIDKGGRKWKFRRKN